MNINNDWKELMAECLNSAEYETLCRKIEAEYSKYKICPPKEKIFAAFNLCPYEKTKVVILGQDPYFNPGQAVGLAFSVPGVTPGPDSKACSGLGFVGYKFPPTLRNIIKEVRANLGSCAVEDGDLTPWVRQGVLLLNTCLTVREGNPLSHKDIGWNYFINSAIKILNEKDDIVFVLWGNNAKQFMPLLTNKRNLVLTSAHPSPLSASHGFIGCGHFKKINDFLIKRGKKAIVF